MKIMKAEELHIKRAVELVKREYETELKVCPQLIEKDFGQQLEGMITELFKQPYSYVAIEEDDVAGYLGFWGPFEGFFGNCKGVFSPLGGSAFSNNVSNDRNKLASKLLSYAMEVMVRDGVTSVALSRYAHDEEVGKGLVLNGFGIRCSDAIMNLKLMYNSQQFSMETKEDNITYCELEKEELLKVVDLRKDLVLHLAHAPACFPTPMDFLEHPENRLENRIFAAKDQNKIIGFIEVTAEEAETFLSEEDSMYNICGAYVNPEYRNGDIARWILALMVHKLYEEGISYLGVDCETLNPTALRFWGKYFATYTYSYHRRIDERIVGYEDYYHNYWKVQDGTHRC